ncbi:hypothetical protein PCANC_21965, partial [Puccinia coronata f. sp. avenae]
KTLATSVKIASKTQEPIQDERFAGLYDSRVFDTNILIGMLTIVKDTRCRDPEPQARQSGEKAVEAIKYLEQLIESYWKVLKIQTSRGKYLSGLSIRNEQMNFQDFGATSGNPGQS